VARTKWHRLIGRSEKTEEITSLPAEQPVEKLAGQFVDAGAIELMESSKIQGSQPLNLVEEPGDERFDPPGELVAFTTSVSKLTVMAVKKANPWSVFWLVLLASVGGLGTLSALLLTGVPAQPDCAKVSIISTDSEKLHCAKVATSNTDMKDERTRVLEAIDLVDDWGSMHPLANDGKTQLDLWSRQLIRVSRREIAIDGDIKKAVEGLKKIPPTSTVYPEAQTAIEKWEQQWAKGSENSASFQQALQKAKWFDASLYLSRVGALQSKYWSRTQYDKMSAQLAREQDGWERYQEAESLALSGDLEDYKRKSFRQFVGGKRPDEKAQASDYTDEPKALAKAIAIGNEVKKDTFVYESAQRKKALWQQRLVEIAAEKYQGQDFAGAIAAASLVPKGSVAYSQAQKWQRLSESKVPPVKEGQSAFDGQSAAPKTRKFKPQRISSDNLNPQNRTKRQLSSDGQSVAPKPRRVKPQRPSSDNPNPQNRTKQTTN
jgi:hypothetical protein